MTLNLAEMSVVMSRPSVPHGLIYFHMIFQKLMQLGSTNLTWKWSTMTIGHTFVLWSKVTVMRHSVSHGAVVSAGFFSLLMQLEYRNSIDLVPLLVTNVDLSRNQPCLSP